MKFATVYILFVVLPILGVMGLLRIGRQLSPSVSVGGTWNVEIKGSSGLDTSCFNNPSWPQKMQMVVSQSGPELTISLNDPGQTMMTGKLDGLSFIAQAQPTSPRAKLLFTFEIDRRAEPDRLTGIIRNETCAGSIALNGTRQAQSTMVLGTH